MIHLKYKCKFNFVKLPLKSYKCLYEIFLSQRPRKSPPAVMSTSRETPCIYMSQLIITPGYVRDV